MKILIHVTSELPPKEYGGINRVVWGLGKTLVKKGHEVVFLAPEGSCCDFAHVIPLDRSLPIDDQVPDDVDIVHLNGELEVKPSKPFLYTQHGNFNRYPLPKNTVFVSRRHAERHGSECFVHNGLDWSEYPAPELDQPRDTFHFLGNAAWRIKNVKGAIRSVLKTRSETLEVLGGRRLNFRMGFRFTLSPRIHFHGMVNDREKAVVLNRSKGLVFPVRWDEPFGLAIIESLYFGCPVFGSPHGSLPELIKPEFGALVTNSDDMAALLQDTERFSREACHVYARDHFNAEVMTERYLTLYHHILEGKTLAETEPAMVGGHIKQFLEWN
ncbi:glycosyltransferase [Oceanospirillum linum]|uniref:Glycosyl transferase n=1 Tax=Oceanospirillum linum TaxID=966 RepID=A0A1T1H7R1_OCELI|nr:glycosyltransferase [Oceanospirillum linum]OOV85901.1 glycosyl transferase [Oceanospirillum linum]SEG51668.1 Glycosyltransferase involved in cell wall bisynthesis [Oleiphilus messinensis]SMP35665.1 Glycosyltransferase involved in cell wall bisynthesis [Oceanospirillum linum]